MDETTTRAEHPGLAGLRHEYDRVTASAGWSASLTELATDLERAAHQRALADATYLAALARFDIAQTAAATGPRRAPYATINALADRFHLDKAAAFADVRAARALYADTAPLPEVRDALAAGAITRRHVDEAVKVLEQVPEHVLARVGAAGQTGAQLVDGYLTDCATALTPAQVAAAGRALLGRLAPDQHDPKDRTCDVRRTFSLGVAADGCALFRGVIPPCDVPLFTALAEQWAKAQPDGVGIDADGQETLFPDNRTAGQRRYDGLAATLRAGLAAHDGPSPDVTVFVTATVEDLTGDGPTSATVDGLGAITRPVLNRLACGATLHRVLLGSAGQVLDLGRAVRLATPGQRKALLVRDGGCVIPGCSAPARSCDAHHLTAWSTGGATDLANLVLLCPRHHTDVHLGLYEVTVRDGVPWTTSTNWLTADRAPKRNPRHHHDHEARHLGDQLRLLTRPPDPCAAKDQPTRTRTGSSLSTSVPSPS